CRAALAPGHLEWLRGRDVRTLRALCRESSERFPLTPAARAAVDIALHDLLGQRAGLPLADVLGRAHDALPTSITIGIKSLQETLAEADEYLARGFRVLKVKIVDANIGYTIEQTERFFERTAPLDIEFVEQPVTRETFDLVRGLPAAWRRRI